MRVVVGILPAAGRPGKVVCMRLERGVCPRARWLTALGGPFSTVAVVCTPGGEGMRTLWSAGLWLGRIGPQLAADMRAAEGQGAASTHGA
jgi:hypothetical protein